MIRSDMPRKRRGWPRLANPLVFAPLAIVCTALARVFGAGESVALAITIVMVLWAPGAWLLGAIVSPRRFRTFLVGSSLAATLFTLVPLSLVESGMDWGWTTTGGFLGTVTVAWIVWIRLALKRVKMIELALATAGFSVGMLVPTCGFLFLVRGPSVFEEDTMGILLVLSVVLLPFLVSLAPVAIVRSVVRRRVKAFGGEAVGAVKLDEVAEDVRPRYQFSLKTFLITMLVVGLAFCWLGAKWNQIRTQERAMAALRALEARVTLQDRTFGESPVAYWAWGLLGTRVFSKVGVELYGEKVDDQTLALLPDISPADVIYLEIVDASITDDGLKAVADLDRLERLSLRDLRITDRGLVHLAKLDRLRSLVVSESGVRGRALEELADSRIEQLHLYKSPLEDPVLVHLGRLPLKHLTLSDVPVTDDGLAHLTGLVGLYTLNLSSTRISDSGLAHLKGLVNCHTLSLAWTQISDDGLRHLAGMKRLTTLDVRGTRIEGAGLVHLPQLEELYLSETPLTTENLRHLSKMPGLRYVTLEKTLLDNTALLHLKKLPPDCQVTLDNSQLAAEAIKELRDASIDVQPPFNSADEQAVPQTRGSL